MDWLIVPCRASPLFAGPALVILRSERFLDIQQKSIPPLPEVRVRYFYGFEYLLCLFQLCTLVCFNRQCRESEGIVDLLGGMKLLDLDTRQRFSGLADFALAQQALGQEHPMNSRRLRVECSRVSRFRLAPFL